MKIALFSSRSYDQEFFDRANHKSQHAISYYKSDLSLKTISIAAGFEAICVFVDDRIDRDVIAALAAGGCRVIALRCSGFNNVDLAAAKEFRLSVVRVPAYSPHAVAQHAATMIMALNRKIYKAYNRIREGNFALDGLLGFDLHHRTVGIIGTGKIGVEVAKIMLGFGCRVIACDKYENQELIFKGVSYLSFEQLLSESDILTLHCPLTPETEHLVNSESIAKMKPGVMIINTSRGGLIDTTSVIKGLKSGKVGYLGLDVYEQEMALFFQDRSSEVITDDVFQRLLTFPNVMITGHQAFFTYEALTSIAETTLDNINRLERGERCDNEVSLSV